MGKVNLMLYSALGDPYFFECFPSAIPKGNHYEFKDYLIFRRPQAIKDVVQIDNYSEFQKAAKDFIGKDIDNPNMLTILEMLKSDMGKLDKAHGFLDASILLTAKLARFLRRQRYMPGVQKTAGTPAVFSWCTAISNDRWINGKKPPVFSDCCGESGYRLHAA